MKWILIGIFIASDPFGSHSYTAEFNTKAACEDAMNDIVQFYRWQYTRDGKYNAYQHVKCYEKGKEGE
jgi:hypothetical protein